MLAALAFSSFVPAFATPSEWAPQRAKPSREYRYVYYPAQRIYYTTEQQIWFWMNGSSWNFGVHLPAQYRSQKSVGMPVMLPTRRPFININTWNSVTASHGASSTERSASGTAID